MDALWIQPGSYPVTVPNTVDFRNWPLDTPGLCASSHAPNDCVEEARDDTVDGSSLTTSQTSSRCKQQSVVCPVIVHSAPSAGCAKNSYWWKPIHSPSRGIAATTAATRSPLGARENKVSKIPFYRSAPSRSGFFRQCNTRGIEIHTLSKNQVTDLGRDQHAWLEPRSALQLD